MTAPGFVILNEVKDLQILTQYHNQDISHCIRDDGSRFRHPERSEGSPNAGSVPGSGDLSLHSG